MKLLRRQERKSLAQIETRLRPENRNCPDSGAVTSRLAMFQDQAEEIVILTHEIKLVLPHEGANGHANVALIAPAAARMI
jgi:hypothetical protein